MSYEQLKLENQLCFPFYAVSRLIIRAYQEDLDKLGITYTQYLVLMILWEKNEQSVNEIAEKLILNTNTVTPLLKRMELMGLLVRKPSGKDQRKVIVGLTTIGQELQHAAAQIPLNLTQKFIQREPESHLSDLLMLKNQLNSILSILKNK